MQIGRCGRLPLPLLPVQPIIAHGSCCCAKYPWNADPKIVILDVCHLVRHLIVGPAGMRTPWTLTVCRGSLLRSRQVLHHILQFSSEACVIRYYHFASPLLSVPLGRQLASRAQTRRVPASSLGCILCCSRLSPSRCSMLPRPSNQRVIGKAHSLSCLQRQGPAELAVRVPQINLHDCWRLVSLVWSLLSWCVLALDGRSTTQEFVHQEQ